MKKCIIENCDSVQRRKWLCITHYNRRKRWRDMFAAKYAKPNSALKNKLCSVEWCDRKHLALSYCDYHYNLFKKKWSATDLQKYKVPVRKKPAEFKIQTEFKVQSYDIDGDIPSEKKYFANVTVNGVRRTMAFYTQQEARAKIRAWKKEELENKLERFQAMFESIKDDINNLQ